MSFVGWFWIGWILLSVVFWLCIASAWWVVATIVVLIAWAYIAVCMALWIRHDEKHRKEIETCGNP